MIHFHGTPITGDGSAAMRILRGRHALVPFARPDDLPIVMERCQSFVLDNSAFSHWKTGAGRVDFDGYRDWVRGIYQHPGFEWCLIPDAIDGDVEENSKLVRDWVRCGERFKGVPVWHLHEPLEYLEWLVQNFQTVALGSSGQWRTPGTAAWWQRMEEARPVICDAQNRPRCKLHGLRMLNPEIFTRIPLASADSTNAGVNSGAIARFGMYPPPTAGQRAEVIAERIEVNNSPAVWIPQAQQEALFA